MRFLLASREKIVYNAGMQNESPKQKRKTAGNVTKNATSPVAVLRRQLNMNQSDFAAALGVNLSTVSQWERGTRQPDGCARKLLGIIAAHPEMLEVQPLQIPPQGEPCA